MAHWLTYAAQPRSDWLLARRYAVPAAMVARATERRLAGDWRGACAAARCDVHLDQLPREIAARLEDDLAHLAPDLLRWHMSGFHAGTDGLLLTGRRIALAAYDGGVLLEAHTPPANDGSQRITLTAGPATEVRATSWLGARHLWDARQTHRLLEHAGGGDRTPFFDRDGRRRAAIDLGQPDDPVGATETCLALQDAGNVEESWLASGMRLADRFIAGALASGPEVQQPLAGVFGAVVPALSRAARAILVPADPSRLALYPFLTRRSWVTDVVTLRLDNDELWAERVPGTEVDQAWELPWVQWQRLPDVDLLRFGLLGAAELHPLVRAALFPEQPDPGYRPRIGSIDRARTDRVASTRKRDGGPSPMTWAGEGFRVRCGGVWHRMACRDGRLTPLDHSAQEIVREQTMSALGGRIPPCAAVVTAWRQRAPGRIPRVLRQLGHHAILAAAHARADEVLRLLDAGLDPSGLRDGDGRGLPHFLGRLDDLGEAVLARLLAAGLDINARDQRGLTPLACARMDGGTANLLDAMVRAGAHDHKPSDAEKAKSR